MKSVVQAIGKIKFGGVIAGFTLSYQLPIAVKELPIRAVAISAIAEIIAILGFLININPFAFLTLFFDIIGPRTAVI